MTYRITPLIQQFVPLLAAGHVAALLDMFAGQPLVDGVRCALEYNVVQRGATHLPPQAGLAVYERGPARMLAAVRIFDGFEARAVLDAVGTTRK